ncbi:MAG TPA: sigma-54 dependent transcriptional regulator [Longimicrobiales bacterium]
MSRDPFEAIIGGSRAAEAMRAFGRRAAAVGAPVLLLGESGTGKGILARAIHMGSVRKARPFVAVNCAAVPESLFESEFFGHVRGAFTGAQYAHKGLFEQAHQGTLFLDEIGELPGTAQAKLLTTLEDGEVRRLGGERVSAIDVRIIAATTVDIEAATEGRKFRVDLLHRLSILTHTVPALRDRNGDIALLADIFLRRFSSQYGRSCNRLTPSAYDALYRHEWPGNVRELANVIEAAVLFCDDAEIPADDLPIRAGKAEPAIAPGNGRYTFHGPAADERRFILQALARYRGNKSQTAMALGMSRNTLHNKLRQLRALDDESGQQ